MTAETTGISLHTFETLAISMGMVRPYWAKRGIKNNKKGIQCVKSVYCTLYIGSLKWAREFSRNWGNLIAWFTATVFVLLKWLIRKWGRILTDWRCVGKNTCKKMYLKHSTLKAKLNYLRQLLILTLIFLYWTFDDRILIHLCDFQLLFLSFWTSNLHASHFQFPFLIENFIN